MTVTISLAAADRGLLTAAELRVAAGLAADDTSQDSALAAAGTTVADIISGWCNVGGDGVSPPTLLQETLVQTLRPSMAFEELVLARRFLGTVSVVENGTTLDASDFEIDAGAGMLRRLYGDAPGLWPCGKIVVTYQAGFATVPRPLADVAAEMVARRTGAARDPLTKRERVKTDGIDEIEREFWVSAENDADITPDMAAKLAPYMTIAVG